MTEGNGMLARLGNVFYWLCTSVAIIALLAVLAAVFVGLFKEEFFSDPPPIPLGWYLFFGGPVVAAIVIWIIGRAARYILAGK